MTCWQEYLWTCWTGCIFTCESGSIIVCPDEERLSALPDFASLAAAAFLLPSCTPVSLLNSEGDVGGTGLPLSSPLLTSGPCTSVTWMLGTTSAIAGQGTFWWGPSCKERGFDDTGSWDDVRQHSEDDAGSNDEECQHVGLKHLHHSARLGTMASYCSIDKLGWDERRAEWTPRA